MVKLHDMRCEMALYKDVLQPVFKSKQLKTTTKTLRRVCQHTTRALFHDNEISTVSSMAAQPHQTRELRSLDCPRRTFRENPASSGQRELFHSPLPEGGRWRVAPRSQADCEGFLAATSSHGLVDVSRSSASCGRQSRHGGVVDVSHLALHLQLFGTWP